MNYPHVWVEIAKSFKFGTESAFLAFVSSYILAFLACSFLMLRAFPSIHLLIAMLSGATLMAVERGNTDLLIFALLFWGVYEIYIYHRDSIGLAPFLVATVLKIYPVFAIAGLVKKPKLLLIAILSGIAYLVYLGDQLALIRDGNTAIGKLSYGMVNLLKIFGSVRPLFLGSVALVSLWLFIGLQKTLRARPAGPSSSTAADLFVTGGAIFTCTYIIGPNWDYRLIFLLFCIPYLRMMKSHWVRESTLASILIVMNIEPLRQVLPFYVSILLKHYVFVVVLSLLIMELKPPVLRLVPYPKIEVAGGGP